MKKIANLGLAVIACICGGALVAAPSSQLDPYQLLEKVQNASRSVSYQGMFLHDQGMDTTTSNIVHVLDKAGVDISLIQLQDGKQIDQIRVGTTLKIIDKNTKSVIVEEVEHSDQFPGMMVAGNHAIKDFYRIEQTGQINRVADRSCFVLRITPKDRLRYGYELCVDQETFLLLRVQSFDHNNEIIEKASFAKIAYKPELTADKIIQMYAGAEWKYQDSGFKKQDKLSFTMKPAPGFSIIKQVVHFNNPSGPLEQYVFSDGLTSISAFLEPLKPGVAVQTKEWEEGSLHIIKQQLGQNRLVILGEVPVETLLIFAKSAQLKN